MNPIRNSFLTIMLVGVGFTAAKADEVNQSSITVFEAGTPAVAEEMNANFAALVSAINDNAQRTAALEAQIATLDPFSIPPIGNSSYTMMTFESLILASNCNFEGTYTGEPPNEVFVPGPDYCSAQSVRKLTLTSGVTILNFNPDGTGNGSDVYDVESLRTPGSNGLIVGLETEENAQTSDFIFDWTREGNVITVQDDTPGEPAFEMNLSYDGAVAAIRFVARGSVDGGVIPVDDDLAGDKAKQYYQALGIAVRN